MGQISQFLRRTDGGVSHFCPACRCLHTFHLEYPNIWGARWQWNGNVCQPTLQPSMHVIVRDPEKEFPDEVCHYWLQNGVIKYLKDCTHELKGLEVPLPPLPEPYRDASWRY